MSLYWPAFEFTYALDMTRLLPYLAAIESSKTASSTSVLPPPWREQPASGQMEVPLSDPSAQAARIKEIRIRKQELLNTNASRAHAWARQRFAPGSAPMSLEDILHMHRMIAEESGIRYANAGALRKDGQRVLVGESGIGYHAGAPALRLPRLMDDYIQFVNSASLMSMPAAIHALVAHFFFTTIHPFEDGSGRVSRLVAAGILFQRGYRGHGFYALSSHFYENEGRYHSLVYQTQQTPVFDLTGFVAFGMEGLAMELRGINSFIKVKLNRAAERTILTPALRKRAEARRRLFTTL
jgi:cell filamentation protein, protein adenylyltransferase